MEFTKPQVLPRKSLMKSLDNGEPVTSKPTLPVKPTIAKKPSISASPNADPSEKPPLNLESPKVVKKVTKTKLKISANDLNKLRTNLFDMKNVDEKGNQILYDVREDEEQISKMNEICELFVAAGYFRARIKGLPNFDKIIGGMCWAIQMCNIDLDIDIFYQENLSIGQKIALTEKIVRVLQRMKCPVKLEPHQIQGMDCIHIFPVIQWLVKKSLETRQQTADLIRSYATWQFNRIYSQSDSTVNSVILKDSVQSERIVNPIKANLCRRFLHPSRDQLTNEEVRIRTTLLEYGVFGTGASQRMIDSDGKVKPARQDSTESKSSEDVQSVETLLDSMTVATESMSADCIKVSSSFVQTIVNEHLSGDKFSDQSEKNFERKEAKLKNEISEKKAELTKRMQNNSVEKLESLKEKIEMLNTKLKEAEQVEKNESEEMKAEKFRLSEMLSALRKQKSELKKFCREERKRIETQIEQLDSEKADQNRYKDKMAEIDKELIANQEKHENVRKQLAAVNKRYVLIQRKFDDVPTRAELAQYQKRFLELYNQLSNKHNETKKFYTLYNSLDDERMYLEKEFNLINSILDNFKKAYHSGPMVKDELLVKFEQTVDSIVQNKNKVELRLTSEKMKRDQLVSEYSDLVEQQRLYFMAVKEFREECKHNESLMMQLENRA